MAALTMKIHKLTLVGNSLVSVNYARLLLYNG